MGAISCTGPTQELPRELARRLDTYIPSGKLSDDDDDDDDDTFIEVSICNSGEEPTSSTDPSPPPPRTPHKKTIIKVTIRDLTYC